GDGITTSCYSPNGRRIVTAGFDGNARVWDVSTHRQVIPPLKHRGIVDMVRFRPDSALLATGCRDGTVQIWDVATGMTIESPSIHSGPITALSFSPGCRGILASACEDGVVRLWDSVARRHVTDLNHEGKVVS